jgi:uncharacterized protein YuzE
VKIFYYPYGDILYIQLGEEYGGANGVDLGDGVVADYDEHGRVTGFEITPARRLYGKDVTSIEFEWLPEDEESLVNDLCGDAEETPAARPALPATSR